MTFTEPTRVRYGGKLLPGFSRPEGESAVDRSGRIRSKRRFARSRSRVLGAAVTVAYRRGSTPGDVSAACPAPFSRRSLGRDLFLGVMSERPGDHPRHFHLAYTTCYPRVVPNEDIFHARRQSDLGRRNEYSRTYFE